LYYSGEKKGGSWLFMGRRRGPLMDRSPKTRPGSGGEGDHSNGDYPDVFQLAIMT